MVHPLDGEPDVDMPAHVREARRARAGAGDAFGGVAPSIATRSHQEPVGVPT
jgi:hypothetical protein